MFSYTIRSPKSYSIPIAPVARKMCEIGELIIFDLLKMGVKLSKSDSRQRIL